MNYIYGVVDPRCGEIVYVGKAKNLEKRIREHTCPANLARGLPLYQWLRAMFGRGLQPTVRILELTQPELWEFYERQWIEKLLPKLNCTPGGDGGPTLLGKVRGPMPEEVREKIRATRLARDIRPSQETRQKIGATHKARFQDNPEEIEKLREAGRANAGREVPLRTREAVSLANRQRIYTSDQCAARSLRARGKNNPNYKHGGYVNANTTDE